MKIRPGDAVFTRNGLPSVVKERDPNTGEIKANRDPELVKKQMRHGYLNGLKQSDRKELYGILDRVKGETEDPQERVKMLRNQLVDIKDDPHKHELTRYLKAEIVHIMNTHNIKPNEYTVHQSDVTN